MECIGCGSAAATERPERTARGYRRFRCRECGMQYNERSGGSLNRTHYPSDVIALVVLWRLRYRLTLRDLAEMFLQRGLVFSHEAVRAWEAKLAPALARRRDVPEGPRPLVLLVSGDRPRRQPRRHHAQRAPRHGGGPGLLPFGQGRHGRDARSRHHGW